MKEQPKHRPQSQLRLLVRVLLAIGLVYSIIWWFVGNEAEAVATAISFAVGLVGESVI